ncbi:MAG: hypothetical protein J6N32_14350 [Clostridia bacterium]|nr:hypothetical protein [Clostridia bacterium]
MAVKTVYTSGADEKTPSHPQYFSWINNTNEGATEEQTLININFFKYLRDKYDMQLDIYAWDAGNLDGARGTYADFTKGKLQKQYPNGYGPIAKAAAEAGLRMGVWGGADGYGDTPEEEAARKELIVSLCRDYGFALFKFDTVCGSLRPEKRAVFAETMQECRKYVPDLVLLNHRNDLGEAEIYATTFLWGGAETYVDVHIANPMTAMHNRAFLFNRGHVPGLQRLTEDHGVCISSCIDYFEDDLIYQAFSRSLILAPEIYGNPWLMRDDELPILANIYNLHRKYNIILVNGMELPDFKGASTVVRGDGKRRFLTTGNATWEMQTYSVTLDESIGLEPCESVSIVIRHPYVQYKGDFKYGETVELPMAPFRAYLVEICDSVLCDDEPTGGAYQVIRSKDGVTKEIKLVQADGDVVTKSGKTLYTGEAFDKTEAIPQYLGTAETCDIPADAEALYEATCFALDNDSLEKRALRRSGATAIPEVQAARDAFFGQRTYTLRGCDSEFLFDRNPDTFFDGSSKYYAGGLRIDGGCMRVDLGEPVDCDAIEIEYYSTNGQTVHQIKLQQAPASAEISADLSGWKTVTLTEDRDDGAYTMEYVRDSIHDILTDDGVRRTAVYAGGTFRYFRMSEPIDRVFAFRVMKNGCDITPASAKVNNLMASYAKKTTTAAKKVTVKPEQTGRLAIAVNGKHGREGVYCAAKVNGQLAGFPERAPSYPSNVWEHLVRLQDHDNTYFMDITPDLVGREIEVYALFNTGLHDCDVKAYLCPKHDVQEGIVIEL